jgi:hypothetical protein
MQLHDSQDRRIDLSGRAARMRDQKLPYRGASSAAAKIYSKRWFSQFLGDASCNQEDACSLEQ